MRENRPYGLEGGESGSTGLPYPYPLPNRIHSLQPVATRCQAVDCTRETSTVWRQVATAAKP